MIDLERKKALEAAVLFVRHTKHCGLVKLFKLLYFLDMLHFRETGRNVTGMSYTALPYGPVPLRLLEEFRKPPADLAETFTIKPSAAPKEDDEPPKRTEIIPKASEADRFLSVREKRICMELIEIFREANAEQMSEISHARGGPWEKAKDKNPGKWKVTIDFLDALSPTLRMGSGKAINKLLMKARAEEFEQEKQRG